MSHDNVAIGAGEVAITPFLSMVPAILTEFGSKETEEIYTKTITLHWACREEGLMSYVIQNYLKVFQEQTCSLGRVRFDVHVYHTGKTAIPKKEASSNEETERDMTAELHEAAGSNKDEEKFTSVDNTSGGQDGKQEEEGGFAMELGRIVASFRESWCLLPHSRS